MSTLLKTRFVFFFSSRRRHTRLQGDWSSDGALPISEYIAQQLASFRGLLSCNGSVGVDIAQNPQPIDTHQQAYQPLRLVQLRLFRHFVVLGMALKHAYHLNPKRDRKSTRLNSSHLVISYAVF